MSIYTPHNTTFSGPEGYGLRANRIGLPRVNLPRNGPFRVQPLANLSHHSARWRLYGRVDCSPERPAGSTAIMAPLPPTQSIDDALGGRRGERDGREEGRRWVPRAICRVWPVPWRRCRSLAGPAEEVRECWLFQRKAPGTIENDHGDLAAPRAGAVFGSGAIWAPGFSFSIALACAPPRAQRYPRRSRAH